MLLSDKAKSLALPMLLCSEEDVEGNHSTSSGKIGEKDFMKANRKAAREEEIEKHGKPINHNNYFKSKKDYTRKDKHKNDF